jgi:hypothetical protein
MLNFELKGLLIGLVFLLTGCAEETKCNVQIIDHALTDSLKLFDKDALKHVKKENNRIAVSIFKRQSDTIVRLVAFELTDSKNFIGCAKVDSLDIFFYSDWREVNGLYRTFVKPSVNPSLRDNGIYDPPFEEEYYYRMGKFIAIPIRNSTDEK